MRRFSFVERSQAQKILEATFRHANRIWFDGAWALTMPSGVDRRGTLAGGDRFALPHVGHPAQRDTGPRITTAVHGADAPDGLREHWLVFEGA